MRRAIAAALAVGVCAVTAVPATAATRAVKVKDDVFTPKSLTVKKGTTITWRFRGKSPHNVTVVDGPATFRSGNRSSGTFKKKLRKKGTYDILCTIHPGMAQTIRVR